jgi:hypothetical protein
MPPLVKTKRQANFKDFKRFGVFKGLVEQKNVVFNSFVCQLGFFGNRGPLKRSFYSRFKLAHIVPKTPIHTRTRQIKLLLFLIFYLFVHNILEIRIKYVLLSCSHSF